MDNLVKRLIEEAVSSAYSYTTLVIATNNLYAILLALCTIHCLWECSTDILWLVCGILYQLCSLLQMEEFKSPYWQRVLDVKPPPQAELNRLVYNGSESTNSQISQPVLTTTNDGELLFVASGQGDIHPQINRNYHINSLCVAKWL